MKKLMTVLLVLAGITATSVLGYWAYDLLTTDESRDATVTIGEGETVQTTLNVSDQVSGDVLVPNGYGTHQTTLTFDIEWLATEGATGDVIVTLESITLGNLTQTEILTMFSLTYDDTFVITHDTLEQFDLLVSFDNEPIDDVMYQQVANNDLIITLNFEVQPR